MKTKVLKYLKIVWLTVLMINLTACEIEINGFWDDDDISFEYQQRSKTLCSRTWTRSYYNIDGNYCTQELDFYQDRTGMDYIRVQYSNGNISTNKYYFDWKWENREQSSIRMRYAPDDISYFNDVWISGNQLNGYFDNWDNFVTFYGRF